ncbi:hypothetical protein FB451DRAFT_1084598 [Mycena latifolia]|nr:hypothetical protein FB451DRAFT_1084598 [Mycena latifolia]
MSSHPPGRIASSSEGEQCNPDINVAPVTRHHGLLASNEIPLESDLTAIKSVISKIGARLAWLDTEISSIRGQIQPSEEELAIPLDSPVQNNSVFTQIYVPRYRLKRLEEERAVLSSFRSQNNAILSPLRRIPPEVLGQIFSWMLPSIISAMMAQSGSDVIGNSPWVLGHISSRWRAVALSTPLLWSLVAIDFDQSVLSWFSLRVIEAQIMRARKLWTVGSMLHCGLDGRTSGQSCDAHELVECTRFFGVEENGILACVNWNPGRTLADEYLWI